MAAAGGAALGGPRRDDAPRRRSKEKPPWSNYHRSLGVADVVKPTRHVPPRRCLQRPPLPRQDHRSRSPIRAPAISAPPTCTAAAGGAALDGSRPNPSDDAPRQGSPPGKGKKPGALADISNTGRRNNARSLSVVFQENNPLVELLKEKTKTIEQCRAEIEKLQFENKQLTQERNRGKDRIKALQQELSFNATLLKEKDAELEAVKQQWKVNSQDVMKGIPSKVAAGVSHQIDASVNSAAEHHFVESRSVMPSAAGCPEPPIDLINKRGRNKRKSESTTGNDIDMSLQNERRHGVMSSGFKEIQEACSSLPEIGTHQIGDTTSNTKRSLSAETQSSLPFNIAELPKALEDTGNERGTSKQKLKNGKGSAIEHTSAKCDSSTLHEDVICPLPQSSSNASLKQKINQKQTDIQTQMAGRRRHLRRAAQNVGSYREVPVNAKMRRP